MKSSTESIKDNVNVSTCDGSSGGTVQLESANGSSSSGMLSPCSSKTILKSSPYYYNYELYWMQRRRHRRCQSLPGTKSDVSKDHILSGRKNGCDSNSVTTLNPKDAQQKNKNGPDEKPALSGFSVSPRRSRGRKRKLHSSLQQIIPLTIRSPTVKTRGGLLQRVMVLMGVGIVFSWLLLSLNNGSGMVSSIRSIILNLWDHEYYHVRHPLHFHKRSQSEKRIRYLTIGSSTTWGYGLEDYDEYIVTKEKERAMMTVDHDNKNDNRRSGARTFASFGRRRRHGHLQAYPYLLSPRVHNAATKVGGVELAALCTQSIVGDENIYDVIILEFPTPATTTTSSMAMAHTNGNNHNGLMLLAQRIRQRFPHATIVLLEAWSPSQFYTMTTTGTESERANNQDGNQRAATRERISLSSWKSNRNNLAIDTNDFQMAIEQQVQTSNSPWMFQENSSHSTKLQDISKSVQAHVVQLPRDENATQALITAKDLFFEIHPNEYALTPHGHEAIAQQIRHVVDSQNILHGPHYNRNHRNVVGTWGSGDQCQLWYETGHVSGGSGPSHKDTKYSRLRLRQFSASSANDSTTKKYALEVPIKAKPPSSASLTASRRLAEEAEAAATAATMMAEQTKYHRHLTTVDTEKGNDNHVVPPPSPPLLPPSLPKAVGGTLTVSNPFSDERMVYLTYMAAPSLSNHQKVYPRTQVILNGKPSVILDPVVDPSLYKSGDNGNQVHDYHQHQDESHHMTRTTAIGFVPCNSEENLIEFTSLQQPQAIKSFRIVGVSLFPTQEKRDYGIATEFALSPEPAQVERSPHRRRRLLW